MKKTTLFKGLILSGALLFNLSTYAQEEATEEVVAEEEKKSETTFSGAVDMYTKYDFLVNGATNSYTSFTGSQGSFEIGMASAKVEHTMGKVGAVLDIGFGKRAEEFAYAETFGTAMAIKQAYVTYAPSDIVTITGGTFGTHIGYELLDAADNRNYSMSYAFSYGPFLNTGLKADFAVTDEFGLMVGVTLPTDIRQLSAAAGTPHKTLIAQASYSTDDYSFYLSGTTGSNNPSSSTNTTQIDFVGDISITDEFAIGLNATFQNQAPDSQAPAGAKAASWWSGVLYAKYDVDDTLNFTYRFENYDDSDGISAFAGVTPTGGASVISNTISANIMVDNLIIIPELRYDLGSENIFTDTKGAPTDGSAYFLLGAAYTF